MAQKHLITRMFVGFAITVAAGLAASQAQAQTITGKASYRERMALPPGAMLEATLEEVSRADAPAAPVMPVMIVASARVMSPGNPPIAFTIAYDKNRIAASHRYVVRVKILHQGTLLFTTDTAVPVITRGNPTDVTVMLRRVGGPTTGRGKPAASPLQDTTWQLVQFQGGDGTVRTPGDKSKYTIAFSAGGRLAARLECNRGSGTWTSTGTSGLTFGPMAMTRAACGAGSMEGQLAKHWTAIRSYVIKDGHLFLSLKADGGTYEYQPLLKARQ